MSVESVKALVCESLRQQDELRYWHHFTFDLPWEPVDLNRFQLLYVEVYPDVFPWAGSYVGLFGAYIAFSEKHPYAVTHEVGHWLWDVLYQSGKNVNHGTADDPLTQMVNEWRKFAVRYLPEGHSYRPKLITTDKLEISIISKIATGNIKLWWSSGGTKSCYLPSE